TSAQGMRWSADGAFVYYQEMADPEQSVYRIRMGRAVPEKVMGFGDFLVSMASQCHFTGVAPDGSVYATVDRGGTDLYALDLKLPGASLAGSRGGPQVAHRREGLRGQSVALRRLRGLRKRLHHQAQGLAGGRRHDYRGRQQAVAHPGLPGLDQSVHPEERHA